MNIFKNVIIRLLMLPCFYALLCSSTLISANEKQDPEYKIIGYYPNWAIYRSTPFKPHDIDANLVTHINYAFVKTDTLGNLDLLDSWADTDYRSNWNIEKPYWGNFRELYDLKQKHPHLKTMISIGGWTLSDTFSEMAADSQSRANFIRNAIEFCHKYNFDGIDIDWEYPGFVEHKGRPQDKKNYTLLLKELHQAAKSQEPALLVTIAAPAAEFHYANIELSEIHQYLDWINLMTYDLHGPWGGSEDPVTNHHSGLYPTKEGNPKLTVQAAIKAYLNQGVPAKKLVMGMPLYGKVFGNVVGEADGLFSLYDGAGTGTTSEAGLRFFSDIKQNLLKDSAWHYFWDNQAQVPYLYNPQKQEFITYDNETSLQLKSKLIKEMGLGGAMVWELGLDDLQTWDAMRAINNELKKK